MLNPFLTSKREISQAADDEIKGDGAADNFVATELAAERRQLMGQAKILVAEDSEVNQFIIRELLATFGIVPDIVANGQEAVEAFSKQSYDLIFMDVQMPVMDGVAATQRIRAMQANEETTADCAIVGLSAHAMSGDRERYLAAGMDDYITKPIDLDELGELLKRKLAPASAMMLWR